MLPCGANLRRRLVVVGRLLAEPTAGGARCLHGFTSVGPVSFLTAFPTGRHCSATKPLRVAIHLALVATGDADKIYHLHRLPAYVKPLLLNKALS